MMDALWKQLAQAKQPGLADSSTAPMAEEELKLVSLL